MALVEHSFWFDPGDIESAQRRLRRAGEAASSVPTFRLSFPHDYSRLPLVRERVLAAVAGATTVSGNR